MISPVEKVYDLGALAPGIWNFVVNSRGTFLKNRLFNAGGVSSSSLTPVDDSSVFVWQHYQDFLGRNPDDQGFGFWTTNITLQCGTDVIDRGHWITPQSWLRCDSSVSASGAVAPLQRVAGKPLDHDPAET